MPKYRGNDQDWLDDQNRGGGARKAKPARTDRAAPLPREKANASVAEVFPNQCRVRLDEDRSEFLCSYRRATVFQHGDARERTPVAVGDRVFATRLSPQAGVIEGVCLRENHLSRPAPGREARGGEATRIQHVIAANVGQMVIVASAGEPLFTPGLVDRYLVAAEHAGIRPLICLNKIDLLGAGDERPTRHYRELGYPVFETSSKFARGTDRLREEIRGKAVVFCGQSGVGKTSLLRTLLGSDVGKVAELSAATGKGRHTTTGAVLLGGPDGSEWIDTPGVREFGLSEIEPEKLKDCFPELRALECAHENCLHEDEEGCPARSRERYASYRRILESLRSGEN